MARPNFSEMTEEDTKEFIKNHIFKRFTINGPMIGKLPKEERYDAINEIYIDLWNNRFNYNPSISDFTTYAFNRGRGVVKAMMQSANKIGRIRTRLSSEQIPISYTDKSSAESLDTIQKIIASLSKDEIRILNLRFVDNESVNNIAKNLNISEQKVYSIIREAKLKCINSDEF